MEITRDNLYDITYSIHEIYRYKGIAVELNYRSSLDAYTVWILTPIRNFAINVKHEGMREPEHEDWCNAILEAVNRIDKIVGTFSI